MSSESLNQLDERPPPVRAGSPRRRCARCGRPESTCYCEHVTALESRTRVVLLQHPREREVAIGTARMASLCLTNSELHVGIRWTGSAALERALSDPERPAALLYPGPNSIDVMLEPPTTPVTLVVIDGTWSQTRKLLRENPELAALPRFAFTPPGPSEYRIRAEPHEHFVSTIEALALVLGALEKKPGGFDALLAPFRAMVDRQIHYSSSRRAVRLKAPRGPKSRKVDPIVERRPAWIHHRRGDLVCLVAEGIIWPYADRDPDTPTLHPNELIHLAAHRLGTQETFERVVAPVHPLAPKTTVHAELSAETIHAGIDVETFRTEWRRWVRESDVLCVWGGLSLELLSGSGAFMPETSLDLRDLAHLESGHVVRTGQAFAKLLGLVVSDAEPRCAGRAGQRLAALVPLAKHFSGSVGPPTASPTAGATTRLRSGLTDHR